ncbi:MAG TPA: hypothetical protein G4O08_04610 [Anaerolineae bacterium]|nr:hypothetical protein [Anaerolineae bacterium]
MPLGNLRKNQIKWVQRFALLGLAGLGAFVIGVEPDLIGMNLTPHVGFVQMSTWLAGLAAMLIGGYAAVRIIRNGRPTSLRAEIGVRLIATGYVFSLVASLADYMGIGTQHFPNLSFGRIQVIGLAFGIVVSVVGLILYWPHPRSPETEE